MRQGAIVALVMALVAAGFLGGRLLSLGQGEETDSVLQLRVSQLEQRLEEIATQTASEADLQALLDRLQALEEATGDRERLTALEDRLAQLDEQVKALASQAEALSRLESQLQAHRDRLDLLEKAFRLGAAVTEELQGEIAALTEQTSQLSQTLEEMKGKGRWADQEELQGLAQRVQALEELQSTWSRLAHLQIGTVDLGRVYGRFPNLEEAELRRILERVGQAGEFDLILGLERAVQKDSLLLYARGGSPIDVTEQVISLLEQGASLGGEGT